MFKLNDEEKNILNMIIKIDNKNKKLDYYTLINALNIEGDTSAIIPVVERLEDDGYIKSDGLIYRYIYITDKGRREAASLPV